MLLYFRQSSARFSVFYIRLFTFFSFFLRAEKCNFEICAATEATESFILVLSFTKVMLQTEQDKVSVSQKGKGKQAYLSIL